MKRLYRRQNPFLVLLVVAAFITLTIVVAVFSARRKNQAQQSSSQRIAELEEKERHHKLLLREIAELSRTRGKNEAALPGVFVLYPIARDEDTLDRLLSKYTIVVAQLINEKSYIDEHEKIYSWCKFRVLDTISQAPPLQSFMSRALPAEILPIAQDELVMSREGGSVNVDGVDIIQHEQTVGDFRLSQKYLLVVSFDPITRTAELALGPQSILRINSDRTLDSRQSEHILQHVLAARHRSSIDQLKRDLEK